MMMASDVKQDAQDRKAQLSRLRRKLKEGRLGARG